MWIEERGTTGDIVETVVGCDCGIAPRSLYDALGVESRALGHLPRQAAVARPVTEEMCKQPYRLLVRSASNAYFPQIISVLSLPEEDQGFAARLNAVWSTVKDATIDTLPTLRKVIEDVRKALEGLTDEQAMALIERRRSSASSASDVSVRQAEFEMLNVPNGTRGRDDPDSSFFAEALPRAIWDPKNVPTLRSIERVVLLHRLREVMALVGFTRFEPVGTDEKGELDLEGVALATLSPQPEWFPAIENSGEGIFIVIAAAAVGAWREREGAGGAVLNSSMASLRGRRTTPVPIGISLVCLTFPWRALYDAALARASAVDEDRADCGYPAAALRERI